MSILDGFIRVISNGGAAMLSRAGLNFVGFTIDDDPANNQITITSTGGSGPVPGGAFAAPLIVNRDVSLTLDAGGSALAIVPVAPSGHVDGRSATISLPANSNTGLIVATALNTNGDATVDANGVVTNYDTTRDYELIVPRVGGRFAAVLRNLGLPDVTLPTIASATVASGSPTHLVIVFSEPVYLPNLTGLSLSFSAGTTRTLVSVVSGQGTNTLTLLLSGSFDGTEVCSFVVGSARTLQNMNGNLIAAASTSITVAFTSSWAMPSQAHMYRGDSITLAGSNVTAMADQVGSANLGTPTAKPTLVTIGAASRQGAAIITSSYFSASGLSYSSAAGVCIFAVMRVTSHGSHGLISLGDASYDLTLYETGGNLLGIRTVSEAHDCTTTFSTTSLVDVMFQIDPSGTAARLYINGTLVSTNSSTEVSPTPLTKIYFGALLGGASAAVGTELYELRIGLGTTYSGTDATAGHTYAAAYYA